MYTRLTAAFFFVLLAGATHAQEHHHHGDIVVAETPVHASTIADAHVRTQADQPVRFYSDLVKGRVVAINFIFTDCTAVCPLMGLRFAQLQTLLGAQSADVRLISISIDPLTDTPARLAAWSKKLGAKPGWTQVTGSKSEIDTLVKSLGSSAVDPASHSPLLIIIDDKHGSPWQRLDGLADPAVVAQILRTHLAPPLNK